MIAAPLANAGVSHWGASNNVNTNGESSTVIGFQVPGNSTIVDGWMHITDSSMATSVNPGVMWDGADFADGSLLGTYLNEDEHLTIKDDGTRSNISSFDVGNISVIMNSKYTYTPGWRHVYSLTTTTNVSECGSQNAQILTHGYDNDFDSYLDSGEIIDTLYYCDTFSLEDTVQSLEITDEGDGYQGGSLSATGGGGSGFSGSYEISSGLDTISVTNAGSGYSTSDALSIYCQCDGSDANASIFSVDSSGAIESISVDDAGSGYTSYDTIFFSISGSGSGASLSYDLESTGVLHSTTISDEGANYTSVPTIIISDSNGTGASITPILGAYFEYELDIDLLSSGDADCEEGGFIISSGLDYDGNRNLGTDEIQNEEYLCNHIKTWEATTFAGLNGSIYGGEQTMSYGVIPAAAANGIVAIGTTPGAPLPAGTDSYFLIPSVSVPPNGDLNNYYMTFDHWYHVDSTSSGGGDGAWVEYRVKESVNWSDWNYVSPDSGYPSTMSTDAPTPTGAPSGAVPVFASDTHSGWVTSTFALDPLVDESSSAIQFRFHIWTDPNATNERPGWFIDDIHFNNDGINYGAWHHGCYTQIAPSCYYSANAYGALEGTIDLSGTNSTSKIEIDMEWDLEGTTNDNACIEISLNQNTWYDISSESASTTSDCASRSGAIPGNGYTPSNGIEYGDQSGALRTVSLDIPNSFHNQASVYFRIVVQTSYYTDYGGTLDAREGLTVDEVRVVDYSGSNLFTDTIESASTMSHSALGATSDDWAFHVFLRSSQDVRMSFEDSSASAPSVSDAPGWSRTNSMSSGTCSSDICKWTLNKIGSNSGPSGTSSFPYAYGIAFSGAYSSNIQEARLFSPSYDIPANGNAFFSFDHWAYMEPNWDGGAVFIKVNGGSWQHFDPGNWYDSQVSYNYHNLYGYNTFASQSSANGGMKNMQASLLNYQGDTIQFKFAMGSDSYVQYGGWFVDNVGVKIANYGQPGDWLSPSFSASDFDDFNLGIIDIDAIIPENTSVRGSLFDANTGELLPGYSNISLPISLSGVDSSSHPLLQVKIHLDSSDPEASPSIKKIYIGGKRFLNADSGYNGWDFSAGVEVVDGLLNATTISGSATSDFTASSRPIKAVSIGGNISSGITVTLLNKFGTSLGSASKGGSISFSTPQPGFAISVNLPTNGWIDRLVVTSIFAAPASNPSIDVLGDGNYEWSFPQGISYGHYGWQSALSVASSSEYTSSYTADLDGINTETVYFRIPADASINTGIISIAPDSDGFDSSVTLSVAGASQNIPSGNAIFNHILTYSQISGMTLISGTHTDSENSRLWREIPVELYSSTAQTVSISRIGVSYTLFENISGLESTLSQYHQSVVSGDPSLEEVDIPVIFNADIGSVSVDGDVVYDFIITNNDFSVPNTLYPDGQPVEIITSHHHLYDNSELSDISLEGSASDGNTLIFKVENSADGLWGSGSYSTSFSQTSGSTVASLGLYSSYVEQIVDENNGYTDILVHWIFTTSWMWDDVDDIFWTARANDDEGETIWPAEAQSGKSGAQAVENDLQIDLFNIYDADGHLISNIYDNLMYPFPIIEGSDLNISGNVRFQDSSNHRPMSSDFTVALNLSGNLYSLQSGDEGEFFGIIPSPSGSLELLVSPILLSIGASSGSNGAQDVTGNPPQIEIIVDTNPPVAGPLQVNTPIGLQLADGMVSDPTTPFRPYITVSEDEARGESLTLRYWRTGVDDSNGDDIASSDEYQSQVQPLYSGLTGQQQIQFSGIDVSSLDNQPIHMYVEGTDWAGLSYADGGTGGGPGAQNAWASVVVAVDEPTQFAGDSIGLGQGQNSAFDLDRRTSDSINFYLLPDVVHTFSVQIDDLNGLNTLDNITVMLCGYGTDLGIFTFAPSSGTLWSPEGSMTTPINYQTETITNSVTKLYLSFTLSWDFPWDDDSSNCKPRVTIDDNLITVAESDVLSALSWKLDNKIVAIPYQVEDMTPPVMESSGNDLYLKQGDEFSLSGSLYYAGSGEKLTSINDELQTQVSLVYGAEVLVDDADVLSNGSFTGSLVLPSRSPLHPTMSVNTEVLGLPGLAYSVTNSDASVTVDSNSPTAIFNQDSYPDSSLSIIETDVMDYVLVTITIDDSIGMPEGPLQISWEFRRGGQKITGTSASGEIPLLLSYDGSAVYQGRIDFTPSVELSFELGDQIALWVTSTDRAGNPIIGLGSEDSPRVPTLRVMEFMGDYTREITTPTKYPVTGDVLTIVTYWENQGKRDGTISIGLWEQLSDGSWRPSLTTQTNGDIEIELPSGSSSVLATFKYETWQEGQPLLVIVVDGDFENVNGMQQEITGIIVSEPAIINEGGSTVWLMGAGIVIVSFIGVSFFLMRGRGGDYYAEDDEDYYDE